MHKVQLPKNSCFLYFKAVIVTFLAIFLTGSATNSSSDNYQKQPTFTDNKALPLNITQSQQDAMIEEVGNESLEQNPKLSKKRFQIKDGRSGWKVSLLRQLPLATPAIAYNTLYIGGGFGSYEFYALDAKTGEPKWLFHCGDDGPTAAVVDKGKVAFNTESCILYVLDAETGKKLWGEWLGDPLMSQPAMKNNKVVMAFPNDKGGHSLVCMEVETDKHLWEATLPGELISAPVIDETLVYASTLEGSIHCFDFHTGKKIFSKRHQATSAPWIWKNQIYVSLREDEEQIVNGNKIIVRNEGQGRITKSGKRDNRILWAKQEADYLNIEQGTHYAKKQAELDASVGFADAPAAAKLEQSKTNLGIASVSGVWSYQGSRPCIIGKKSYTAMGDTLKALDAETGKVLWKHPIKIKDSPGGRPLSPPAYANNKLYLGSVSGDIICLDASNGKELWRYNCGESIRFQPVIVDGYIYWGTDAGSVFCIEAKDSKATGWSMWGGNAQHNYQTK